MLDKVDKFVDFSLEIDPKVQLIALTLHMQLANTNLESIVVILTRHQTKTLILHLNPRLNNTIATLDPAIDGLTGQLFFFLEFPRNPDNIRFDYFIDKMMLKLQTNIDLNHTINIQRRTLIRTIVMKLYLLDHIPLCIDSTPSRLVRQRSSVP